MAIKVEHTFLGLDADTSQQSDKWQAGSYIEASNIRVGSSEEGNVGAVENIKGNIPISFSLPSGTNKCIGAHEDVASNSVYYFLWNSGGRHTINKYDGVANTISRIYPADPTQATFLNFGQHNLITGTGFVNNMLFWTDKINPPRKLNVVEGPTYPAPYIEAQIDFVKIPPTVPIKCTSRWLDANGNPSTYTATPNDPNYMNKRSFQFIHRYIYKDNERSVWSVLSKLIPTGYSDSLVNNIVLTIDNDEVNNATEYSKVISFIEIGFRDGYSDTNGDAVPFKFMKRIDFPTSNGVVTYSFMNDQAYPVIDPAQTAKYFESVPLYCGALTLANNRVFTGDNIEGFAIPQSFSAQGMSKTPIAPTIDNIYFMSGSRYAVGVVFYDRADRKSGVQNLFSFTTDERHGAFAPTQVSFLMAGTPPVWATHWQIVRTASRNKSFFLQVLVEIVSQTSDQFICTLNGFNSKNVSYNFTKGDKCNIVSYKLGDSALPVAGYQDNLQVVGQDGNNITVKWTKGANTLQSGAMLEFYTPILSTEIDQYYEIGEAYPVINPGASDRRFGNDNVNTGKFLTMGTAADACGDIHYRHVTNPVGAPPNAYAFIEFRVNRSTASSNVTYTAGVTIRGITYSHTASMGDGGHVNVNQATAEITNKLIAAAANGANLTVSILDLQPDYSIFRVYSNIPGNDTTFTGDKYNTWTGTLSSNPIDITGAQTPAQAGNIYVLNNIEAMSANDDFYENWQKNIGRVNVTIIETERQVERTTQIRFGGQFVQDTQVNALMSFDFLNQKVLPIEFGTICKLQVAANNQAEGSVMLSIHANEIASVYLGQTTIKGAAGGQTIGLTDDIIGSVNPMAKGIGCVNPESVKQFNGSVYGFDFLRGIVWRYAQNGLDNISSIGVRNYFYGLSQAELNGTNVAFLGGIDPYHNEYILSVQATVVDGTRADTIAWSENVNRWTTFYDFPNVSYSRTNTKLVSFKEGALWLHRSNELYNNFYGFQLPSILKMVSQGNKSDYNKVKILQRIEEISTDLWDAVDIQTPEGQSSELVGLRDPLTVYDPPQDWWKSENTYYGNVMRDRNTPNEAYPLLNGDMMRSRVFTVNMQNRKTTLSTLFSVNLYYIYSMNTR